MAKELLVSLGISLGLTVILEELFALLWGLRGRNLGLVALMNVMTNPAVVTIWFLARHMLHWNGPWLVLLLEALVVVAEGLCCRGQIKHPWLFTLLVNLFSYSMGQLIQTNL